MTALWIILVILGAVYLIGVGYLWLTTIAYSMVGEFFWSRFARDLGVALLWPAWFWRKR